MGIGLAAGRTQRNRRSYAAAFASLLLLVFAGCGKTTLVDNTSQKRAMQIVVALYKHGLSATTSRETGGQDRYRVEIDENHYAQALAAIERDGLLDDPAPSFEELTASSSFFPASREVEALRMDYALAVEMKRVLEEMPGIERAQVLVRKRFGSKEETIPSVSILLRTTPEAIVDEHAVRDLAHRSVPGLADDRVFITKEQLGSPSPSGSQTGALNDDGSISYVPLVPFIFKWRVPKDDYTGFALLFLSCFFLIGVVSVMFGYMVGQIRGRRQRIHEGGETLTLGNRNERPKRDLLEG